LPFGIASTALLAVAASYAAESELLKRVRLITAERRYLQKQLSAMGIYSTDAHANFVYLPSRGRPWREVLADSGLQVRYYSDGGARITVGSRASSLAVLSVMETTLRGKR
jgi:histidinol-phosphate aminotransferase